MNTTLQTAAAEMLVVRHALEHGDAKDAVDRLGDIVNDLIREVDRLDQQVMRLG
jgi:hypothetical protein